MQKIFKTIDEQVEILRNKGLIIDDEENVRETLLRENYFFISGYRHPFIINDKLRRFKEGTNFRELYALFNFDRQLRNIVFKYLLVVENNLKSIFSYQLSKNYGFKEKDYLKSSNFNTSGDKARQVNDLLRKIKRQIRVNGGQHSATTHYIYNYGYVPLWVAIKVLSFGIVCELYSIMKRSDQEEIADIFHMNIDDLLTFLPILANYRNLCAHEDILYDHKTATMIPSVMYHRIVGIDNNENFTQGRNDLFALVIVLKFMLTKSEFRLFLQEVDYEISVLSGKLNTIKTSEILSIMGFPRDYMKLLDI